LPIHIWNNGAFQRLDDIYDFEGVLMLQDIENIFMLYDERKYE
jgi:hypothetical protein